MRYIALIVAGFVFLLTSCGNPIKEERKPNIIYILADDLGIGDIGVYGQEKIETPNIDRLAAEGIKFTQHYSGSTVCSPSRSALLTGQHTGHTPIRGNREYSPEGQYPMPADAPSLAKMMKEAGYSTGAFGKWGVGYPNSEGDPIAQGFDVFYGYNCQRNAHHYYPQHLYDNNEKVIIEENAEGEFGAYAPELIQKRTLKFIEDNKDKPFFLYYPSVIPHAELLAPEKNMEKYRGKLLPEKSFKGRAYGNPQYAGGTYNSQAESHAAFAAMVDYLDIQVGEIMDKLKELGIDDNTLVIFTSDNGAHREGGADPKYFNSTAGLRGYKRDLYEGGIRTPLLAKWPGKIQPGSESNHISAFWDVLPTIAEITGQTPDERTDGISFLPSLTGKGDQEKHKYLYWEFHPANGRQAVRMGKWKGVKYNVMKEPAGETELYDLENDMEETTNIAEQHPEIVKQIEEIFSSARIDDDYYSFKKKTE